MSIAAGEQLTERQALQALLLPSANNIAAVLARWDAGSADRFVARMNATARSLGMTHTRYTDPSGYDDATVSTAADQVRIVDRAMRLPVFASIVAIPSATLPVAGTVHNTNTLLGRTGLSASRPARTRRPAAASPSGPSAGSTASGRRSPGSCWASPATTGSRRVSAAAAAMVDRITGHGCARSTATAGIGHSPDVPGDAAAAGSIHTTRVAGRPLDRPAMRQGGVMADSTGVAVADPIKVGVIADQTGPLSFVGLANANVARMVIDELNAGGGLLGRHLALMLEDSATDDAVAAAEAAKLVGRDQVDVVFGGIYSSTRQAIKGPVVVEGKTLYIYPEQYEGQESDPLIFCTGPVPAQQVDP